MEIRYFDCSDGLDEDNLCRPLSRLNNPLVILNGKIDELQDLYNAKLGELNEINEDLRKKIDLINDLNDPNKFKFDEMNAKSFITKLARIETDVQTIWDALNSVFGEGYFTK